MHKTETWNLIKGSFLAHLFLGNFPWIKILKSSSSARNNSKVVIWLWGMRRIHQLPLHKGPIIPFFHHHHHLHHPHHHHHHPRHHHHHVQHHYHHRDGNSSKIQPYWVFTIAFSWSNHFLVWKYALEIDSICVKSELPAVARWWTCIKLDDNDHKSLNPSMMEENVKK